MIKLSILIPTTEERAKSFNALIHSLKEQDADPDKVEIIVNATPKKEMSIGDKRQALLEKAKGEYVVMIDSDEIIMNDYIERILTAIGNNKPDCIALTIPYILNGFWVGMCYHSMKYKHWHQVGDKYYRGVTPNNPVRRELALKAGFGSERYGEDFAYTN